MFGEEKNKRDPAKNVSLTAILRPVPVKDQTSD